jgi:hypothetical protein
MTGIRFSSAKQDGTHPIQCFLVELAHNDGGQRVPDPGRVAPPPQKPSVRPVALAFWGRLGLR